MRLGVCDLHEINHYCFDLGSNLIQLQSNLQNATISMHRGKIKSLPPGARATQSLDQRRSVTSLTTTPLLQLAADTSYQILYVTHGPLPILQPAPDKISAEQ